MEIRKPATPPKIQEKSKELYAILKTRKTYTKQHIAEYFGVSERTAREIISTLAKRQPIIATSDQRGYRLACTTADAEEVRHQIAELNSRISELQARKAPLERFMELYKKYMQEKEQTR